jgi:hypothetical protein
MTVKIGYIGGVYKGGHIEIATDTPEYELIRDFIIKWGEYKGFKGALFQELHYVANQSLRRQSGFDTQTSIGSNHLPGRTKNEYRFFINDMNLDYEKEIEVLIRNLQQEYPQLDVVKANSS